MKKWWFSLWILLVLASLSLFFQDGASAITENDNGLLVSFKTAHPARMQHTSLWNNTFETTLYTDIYNANYPYNVHIHNLDGANSSELLLVGALTDYSWIPTPNVRCSWCNQWQLDAYTWDGGSTLTSKYSQALDVGYDTAVYSAVDALGGSTKIAGVGNLYPCGSGEPHGGMAVFDNSLQNEHYDWGGRRPDPCHHDFSVFTAVDIADVDKDGTGEIIAGGSGDSTGGKDAYREWLLTIRTSDGETFTEELYQHIDHGSGTELITDLIAADVDGDSTLEILAAGYSKNTGVTRTWLHIMTWNGTSLQTEFAGSFDIGLEDYLHRLTIGDLDNNGDPEIVLAGRVKTSTTQDWYVKVLRWDGTNLTHITNKSWNFASDSILQAVKINDVDGDGKNELIIAGNIGQEQVPGATGGYGYVHYYADWHLKTLSLSGTVWTEEFSQQWDSSRDYDSNNNGTPDSNDQGALGRLYDLDVGDLTGDGQINIALVGEWVWTGWHVKILDTPTIQGKVFVTAYDSVTKRSSQFPLKNAAVYLTGSTLLRTTTDENGRYHFSFQPPADGHYWIMVDLRHGQHDGSEHYFKVHYQDTDFPAWVMTPEFNLNPGQNLIQDIDFTDATLDGPAEIPQDKLGNLALTYYYEKQAFDFMQSVLGVTPLYNAPLEVFAYSTQCADPTGNCYNFVNGEVHIAPEQYDQSGRPENAEWHETFHHLMHSTITIPPLDGNTNHGGYSNDSTSDSWAEGYAIFWPMALISETYAISPTGIYRGMNYEINFMAWGALDGANSTTIYREDYAVASLLWDLYDDEQDCGWSNSSYADYCDRINLSAQEIWTKVGDTAINELRDMYDVYLAFSAYNVDSDGGGMKDLDEIFILHGFFADTNPDNGIYDPDEVVGKAAHSGDPDRSNTPFVPGANLKLNFENIDGDPVDGNFIQVQVSFSPPDDNFNYSYEEYIAEGSAASVYLELPPEIYPAKTTIHPRGGRPATDFETDTGIYWQKVRDSTTGYAAQHTFTIEFLLYLPLITP